MKQYSDSIKQSRSHPQSKSIPTKNVPQFISLGFDDNGIADYENRGGASWILQYLRDKKNPLGSGNPLTFDGFNQRSSFYMAAKYGREKVYESHTEIQKVWKELATDGHEIGNHGTEHLMLWDEVNQECINYDGRSYSTDEWLNKELLECKELLSSPDIGFSDDMIFGWRTPRLEWNNALFSALVQESFLYDCSIETEFSGDGTSEYWPFTLDDGHPQHPEVDQFEGLWEMPAYTFHIPKSLRSKTDNQSVMTGLDFNVWAKKEWGSFQLTGPEFTEILIYTLDQRMKGNRAPMLVGLHSDIYSDMKNEDYPGTKNARERQLAIENFLEYAVNTYPEVRVVPTKSVIDWMRNPVSL